MVIKTDNDPGLSNMESFLVYLFNFYYAISELEQNKQNNTINFFLLFIFLTKKWTSAVCGGVRAHPSYPPPPLPTGLTPGIQTSKATELQIPFTAQSSAFTAQSSVWSILCGPEL